MARHRPAAEGGYQRGEETRARIIAAALRLFGERGFDGASTREIAAEAGVNAPALQYYFNNKEGVYVACIEHIITRAWEQIGDAVASAEAVLANSRASDAELIDAYLTVMSGIVSFVHESPESRGWRLFMAREQVGLGPEVGFTVMNERMNLRVFGVTSSIIGRLLGRAPNDEVTMIRTFALNGQALMFRVMRRAVLEALHWDTIDVKRMALVREVILGQTRELLYQLTVSRNAGIKTKSKRTVAAKGVAGAR